MTDSRRKIAIISPHREYMGDTRSLPILAKGLAERGHRVDLLQSWREWEHVDTSRGDSGVRIVNLRTRWFAPVLPNISKISKWASYRVSMLVLFIAMMPGLITYLYRSKPDILIVRMLTGPTILAIKLFRPRTKILISSSGLPRDSRIRRYLWSFIYDRADGYVVAAPGVAQMVSEISGISASDISVLWEAVLDDEMTELSNEPPTHRWLVDGDVPVVVGLGRLTRQKDFGTLIRAFAKVRASTPARLVIFGEGEDRDSLVDEISKLGLEEDADLPGFIANPYSHLRKCDVYVLSSIWESSNHSLTEAQGLGVPSVTTDCPSGQREIAMDGETALVVPVRDADAMADAIGQLINDRSLAERISTNALNNSGRFRPESVAREWELKINAVINDSIL